MKTWTRYHLWFLKTAPKKSSSFWSCLIALVLPKWANKGLKIETKNGPLLQVTRHAPCSLMSIKHGIYDHGKEWLSHLYINDKCTPTLNVLPERCHTTWRVSCRAQSQDGCDKIAILRIPFKHPKKTFSQMSRLQLALVVFSPHLGRCHMKIYAVDVIKKIRVDCSQVLD